MGDENISLHAHTALLTVNQITSPTSRLVWSDSVQYVIFSKIDLLYELLVFEVFKDNHIQNNISLSITNNNKTKGFLSKSNLFMPYFDNFFAIIYATIMKYTLVANSWNASRRKAALIQYNVCHTLVSYFFPKCIPSIFKLYNMICCSYSFIFHEYVILLSSSHHEFNEEKSLLYI